MFCGGKKKDKEKDKKGKQPIQLDQKDLCPFHGQPYTKICYEDCQNSQKTGQRRICENCMAEHSKCQTISLPEFRLLLGEQQSFDLFDEIKKQIQLDAKWDNEWNDTFKNSIQHFKEVLNKFIEQIITNFFFDKTKIPKIFSAYDCNLLLNSKTIYDLEEVANQRKLIQDLEDDKLYLFAKLFQNKQETKRYYLIYNIIILSLLASFQPDLKSLKQKLESIQKELKQQLQQFEDSICQINLRYQQTQQNLSELYSFINQSQIYTNHDDIVSRIKKIKTVKTFENHSLSQEQVQVKAITQWDDFLSYATNEGKVIIITLNGLVETAQIDCQGMGEIMALSSIKIKNEYQLIIALEIENENYLTLWNLGKQEKVAQIKAHERYIWKIVNLPDCQIATCSDEPIIKVFNMEQVKEVRSFGIHQAAVNDIALVGPKKLVSVSDDSMIVINDFTTGDIVGMKTDQDEDEVKCVTAIDGITFGVGNGNGKVSIYSIEPMELLINVKLHQEMIRSLTIVTPKIIVTSSWDGYHCFYDLLKKEIIYQVEGPKVNLSEAMCYVSKQNYLVSGSNGTLKIYQ